VETTDVTAVELKRPDGIVKAAREGDGWQVTEPVTARGDRGAIEETLTTVVTAKMDREIDAAPKALGDFGLAYSLVPGPRQPMTIDERVNRYTARPEDLHERHRPATEPFLDQARAAAGHLLGRHESLESKIEQRLSAAGSGFRPGEWLLLHIGVVLGAGAVGTLLGGGSVRLGVLFLGVGFTLPPLWLRWQATRRRRSFDSGLPETLQLMSGALSAGLSLAQAVDTIVREGPDPIAGEFKRVLVENRIGLSLEDAFDGVAARYQSRDLAWVVMAIRIQREVGGNLAELLATVAETMRERKFLRRQVQTLAAEGKLSALVLCALPPAFFVFVMVLRPGYMDPMFEQVVGWLTLGGAAAWLALGVFWMSRLVKVEI
jgi:tight adherence protein B